jgi:diguanylate cyclase (GGDEF)-like protein
LNATAASEDLMNLAYLPDLVSLALLVSVLLLVRRRYCDERTNAWLLGLFVTLIESVTQAFYAPSALPGAVLRVTAVDCYLLAGLIFVWASSDPLTPRRTRVLYLGLNGVPLLALTTIYGLNIRNGLFYTPAIGLGICVGVATSMVLCKRHVLAFAHIGAWLAIALLIEHGFYRTGVYWAIGFIYSAAAINFYRRLEAGSTGKIAIVSGFSIWALFFFLHSWIASHIRFTEMAIHVWNMQKSLISLGMILILLEARASADAYLAHHDELTGLPNRRLFAARLSDAVESADRRQALLAIIVLDLNGFKAINDTQGHVAGDFVLREVAGLLRKSVRTSDTVARMGGDEFIVLADGIANDLAAWKVAESIQNAIDGPMSFQGTAIQVSVSMGIAAYPSDGIDPVKLLRIADQRMYNRKKGPGSVGAMEPARIALPSA